MDDLSNGYEGVADEFILARTRRAIGLGVVEKWIATLPPNASVLDLGCGPGEPITRMLFEAGLDVYGVDASPAMVAAFRKRLPGVPVACEAAEASHFFGRQFDAVVACGLMFLLPGEAQTALIHRVAAVINPGGSFLFTAPKQVCSWRDVMTGRTSASLGRAAYKGILQDAGLELFAEDDDEGDNHYFHARRESGSSPTGFRS